MPRPFRLLAAVILLALPLAARADEGVPSAETPGDPMLTIETTKGKIVVELFQKEAPKTVENFMGLALGTKEFTDPATSEKAKRAFYDGLAFHRVIKGFMIQGGDPLGTGMGGPGYEFEDEIDAKALGLDKLRAVDMADAARPKPHPWLLVRSQQDWQNLILRPVFEKLGITSNEQAQARKSEIQEAIGALTLEDVYESRGYVYREGASHHKPAKGTLAMANSGPNTNGSQFFINLVDNDYLSGKHTVFGKVIAGMDVVEAIGNVPVDGASKPKEPVKILSVKLVPPPPPK